MAISPSSPARSNQPAGFTIIEVLIVLAIAGLIMLLVFEAVPALQRANRNGERKNDAAAILQAVSHYMLNDSGSFPQLCGDSSSDLCNTAPVGPNSIAGVLYYTKLNLYSDNSAGGVVITPQNPVSLIPDGTENTNSNTVEVYNYEKCDPNTIGAAESDDADYRNVVVLYALEVANSNAPGIAQCQQL